jgi:hypothetical protein
MADKKPKLEKDMTFAIKGLADSVVFVGHKLIGTTCLCMSRLLGLLAPASQTCAHTS